MQPSSTVAKVGATSGILAIVMMIASYFIPLLPSFGVSKDISDKAQQAYQWAKDHPEEMAVIQKQLDGIVKPQPIPVPTPPAPVPTPVPTPTPVPVPPVTPVVPPPPPVPVPVPPVVPVNPPTPTLLPLATVVVADTQGKQIIGNPVVFVESGRPFVVNSKGSIHADLPGSVSWVIDKSSPQDVDAIAYPDGSGYFCVLRNRSTATFSLAVASSGQVSQAMVRVSCNNGPMPPPDVTPVDPKPVDPKPVVDNTPVSLYLVYNPQTDTPDVAIIRNNVSWWEKFEKAGNKWQFFTVGTQNPVGTKAIQFAAASGVSAPFFVVEKPDGTPVKAFKPPLTVDGIIPAIQGN